jgi:predicted nucleic acid-binding protein
MNAIDTNIWVYCYDDRYPEKQQKARALTASIEPLFLPWQVGCEFVAAARKLEPFGFTREQAWDALERMDALADVVLFPDRAIWRRARSLQERFSLQFWDALLVAACAIGGVKTVYSEDMQHGAEFDGVTIVNPFLPSVG